MRLQTILNCVERNKSFVYGVARLEGSGPDLRLMVPIRPRKDCRPECPGCGRKGSTYDRQKEPRLFEFVPLWGGRRVFRLPDAACELREVRSAGGTGALVRRQEPADHQLSLESGDMGETVELERGGDDLAHLVEQCLPGGRACGAEGLPHRNLCGVMAIGVDEVAWQKGHKYLTLR